MTLTLEREKSISLDASLNEKRILGEKSELLKTEKALGNSETEVNENLNLSKNNLDNLKKELNNLILKIKVLIDKEQKISKDFFDKIEDLINKITSAHENYATNYSKNETVRSDSIKEERKNKKY